MLSAGFPPEHAFRSLNALLVLRGQAGAVTLDLAELRLDSGRVFLYKWGAAPSYLLRKSGTEKIGTATPPPGLDLGHARETVEKLSLRRGEVLILVSDGVRIGEVLSHEMCELFRTHAYVLEKVLLLCGHILFSLQHEDIR